MSKPSPKLVQVGRWVSTWKRRLLLDLWGVSIFLRPKDKTDKKSKTTYTVAEITVIPKYTDANLYCYPALWNETKTHQELTIVHELIHIITNPARLALFNYGCPNNEISDIIENMTEHFAKALLKSYGKKGEDYKL